MAQNVSSFENGAFTGEISVDMLKDIGVGGVLLGHSERRRYFGETDEIVAEKTSRALSRELVPVVCFGENEEERRTGSCFRIWDGQVRPVWEAVLEAKKSGREPLVYWAYEPVWAIGTGKTAVLGDIREVSVFLREKFGPDCSAGLLYGGSVTDESVSSQFEQGTVHGFLVGSAFLDPECVVRTFGRLLHDP
jgi:triosephosphate isomerase